MSILTNLGDGGRHRFGEKRSPSPVPRTVGTSPLAR